jgi:flagellin
MAITVNTNISSLNAQRNLVNSGKLQAQTLQRLSSGLRINSAKDDAAGLAISTRMNAQVRGLNQAARNANDGISMAQTAEGALQESSNILQRIRELAIQSANDSNSGTDRTALNSEVQQLLAEAQRISVTTQFNGKSIIDGSLQGAQFHVGAYANQTISVNVGNAQNSALGSYQVTSGGTAVTSAALAAGDLLINGIDVGVSTSGSAESKVTAINGIADQTGVTATASTTLESTNALVRNQTLQAGDLVINGVNVGAVAGSNNLVTQGANIADAINAVSNQTGVQATSSQSTGALTLTSSTGKDIVVESATANGDAGATRLANASGLVTVSGATTNSTNTVTFAGGTAGQNALTVTGFDTNAGTTIIALGGETVTIQGVTFEYTDGTGATGSNIEVDLSAVTSNDDIATALNTAIGAQITAGNLDNVTTGVAANVVTVTSAVETATTTHIDATMSAGASVAEAITNNAGAADGDTLNIGGVTYEFGFAGDTPTSGNILVALASSDINLGANFAAAVTAQYTAGNTNIQAADGGAGVITLTSDLEGSGVANLAVTEAISTGTAGAVVGGAAAAGTDGTATGETGLGIIELNSASSFLLTGANTGKAGLATANVTLSSISAVDISTAEGANAAIALMDGALSQVTSIRGDLGAVQNRFESTISNLMSTAENISAAQARIMDADFAAESANLTKAQILQQAGLAMLAQANTVPQAALTLLQG